MGEGQGKERRQSPRVAVDHGVVQILGMQKELRQLKLRNISCSGLAFECERTLGGPKDLLKMNVVVIDAYRDHDLFLTNVRGRIVAGRERRGKSRCYRLNFVGLSDRQHHQVEQFCQPPEPAGAGLH